MVDYELSPDEVEALSELRKLATSEQLTTVDPQLEDELQNILDTLKPLLQVADEFNNAPDDEDTDEDFIWPAGAV